MQFIKPLTDAVGKVWDKVTGAFSKGFQKGVKEVEDEKKAKKENENTVTKITDLIKNTGNVPANPAGAGTTPTKTIDYDKLFSDDDKKKKSKKGKSSGEGESDGVSMSGSKGPRTINMTLTINNSFAVGKGVGSIEHIANKITGSINDRLRDGLVALD